MSSRVRLPLRRAAARRPCVLKDPQEPCPRRRRTAAAGRPAGARPVVDAVVVGAAGRRPGRCVAASCPVARDLLRAHGPCSRPRCPCKPDGRQHRDRGRLRDRAGSGGGRARRYAPAVPDQRDRLRRAAASCGARRPGPPVKQVVVEREAAHCRCTRLLDHRSALRGAGRARPRPAIASDPLPGAAESPAPPACARIVTAPRSARPVPVRRSSCACRASSAARSTRNTPA